MKELTSKQAYTLSSPRFCGVYCAHRPTCYTDFEPNYNPSRKFTSILVEPADPAMKARRWNRVQFRKDVPGIDKNPFGWLDRRPIFESAGQNSSIYLKLEVKAQSFAIVCGFPVKESLKAATFYLDTNVTVPTGGYVPSPRRTLWKHRRYFNSECTVVEELPR